MHATEEAMFGFHDLIDFWKGEEPAPYRFIPTDAHGGEHKPFAVRPPAVAGRSEKADLVLNDPWVSRIHCEFFERDGELWVRDLESRHGVFVNGERLPQAPLHDGDVIFLGVSRFRLEVHKRAAQHHSHSDEAGR